MRTSILILSAVAISACQGASGPQGPAAPKGDNGATGPQGNVGPEGARGDQGIPGRDATAAETAAILQASSGFKADLVDDLGADTAFGTRISTGAANRLAADATFQTAITGGAANLLAGNSAFQDAVAGKPALLDGVKSALAADGAFREAVALTTTDTVSDLTPGLCHTMTHNLGTIGVFYQVWMTDNGNWVPMQYTARDGGVNIALGRPCSASSIDSAGYVCNNAFDGAIGGTGWHSGAEGTGQITVDLGSVTMVDRVRVAGHSYTTGWQIELSTNGTSFGSVASGACSVGGSCGTLVETTFTPQAAQWVRIRDIAGSPTYGYLYEVEVFGAVYPVVLPNGNQLRLCNMTGRTRHFTIAVGR